MARLKNTSTLTLSPFEQQLKKVLKWFDSAARIGKESPLASIYFLSGLTAPIDDRSLQNAETRGEILRQEIRRAATMLWGGTLPTTYEGMLACLPEVRQDPGSSRYAYIVLELRCFQDFLRPQRTADIWLDEAYLPGSQSEHYRDYDAAVVQLGRRLLERLHPNLRGEQPPPAVPLIGYAAQIEEIVTAFNRKESIALQGPSGIGKSSVAAVALTRFQERPIFWFTVRAALNDHLAALLFALGHFFQRHGANKLWQLVLASGGTLDDYQLALDAIRADHTTLATLQPLFCLDELDVVTGKDEHAIGEERTLAYQQFIPFLEGLSTIAPLLLIGQQIPVSLVRRVTLPGLATPQIVTFFAEAGQPIAGAIAADLYRVTGGNPRLLSLIVTLSQRGAKLTTITAAMADDPALAALFQRLWLRLHGHEQHLLRQLAVFRRPAPIDQWVDADAEITELMQKRLLLADGSGGIEVLPALRLHLYGLLTADEQRGAHQRAAEIRLLHAEYTAAAYHLICAGQTTTAIQLWFVQREQEVRRGQANAAFALFTPVDASKLGGAERQALAIIQAELYKLRGNFATALAHLNETQTRVDDTTTTISEAHIVIEGLRGEFLEMLGQPEAALQRYETALQLTGRLLNRQITLHHQRSMLHVRQRDLGAAWREVSSADAHLQIVRGILADEEGRYDDAQAYFQAALIQAQTLEEPTIMALAERHLANTCGRLQDMVGAEAYAQQAIARYEAIGDAFNVARVYDNLAFSYIHAGALQKGIVAATQAFQFFQAAKSTYYSAVVATNLAEALFDAGDLGQAEEYAHYVLNSEERHPRPYALFTLGRIHEARAQLDYACHSFRESVTVAIANQDRFMEAYARRALALVLRASGQACNGELSNALQLFEDLSIAGEVAATRALLLHTDETSNIIPSTT